METEGRHDRPATAAGDGAAVADHSGWKLLVATVDGRITLWDLQSRSCILEASLAPLLAGITTTAAPGAGGARGVTLFHRACPCPPSHPLPALRHSHCFHLSVSAPVPTAVRLFSSGLPLVVLSDGRAFLYDPRMR